MAVRMRATSSSVADCLSISAVIICTWVASVSRVLAGACRHDCRFGVAQAGRTHLDSAAAHARATDADARVVAVQHPLAALAPEAVMQRADAVVERIIEQLMTTH